MTSPDSTKILSPAEITQFAEDAQAGKANGSQLKSFLLALPAGAFIALGFVFFTTTQVGAAGMPYGVARLIGGVVFSTGLALVVVTGAELFTGSTMTLMPLAAKRLSLGALLKNWGVVYVGNLIGSLLIAALIFFGGTWRLANGGWGAVVLNTALAKIHDDFFQAFCLGILCNLLVCLAVWMAYAGKTVADKVLGLTMPIALFVASGFEHSVANMFMIPLGGFIAGSADSSFYAGAQLDAAKYADLTWGNFLVDNLLPVTLGNIVGGGVMVGLFFWYVFQVVDKRSTAPVHPAATRR